MVKGLTTAILARACRTFLMLAYPEGPNTVPAAKRRYLDIAAEQPLAELLTPPVCEVLRTPQGEERGVALRLGSATFPHLKMQIVHCQDEAHCIFGVDTHDAFYLAAGHPEAETWTKIRIANTRLKVQIEDAWEKDGLLTFNGMLRRELEKMPAAPAYAPGSA